MAYDGINSDGHLPKARTEFQNLKQGQWNCVY